MATPTITLPEEYEQKIREDCDKLYVVLKNCEQPDDTKDEESLKLLHRVIFLISYRQGSKMMALTQATLGYLCHHPLLPVVLVEVVRDTTNIKICTFVLEILAKLILKNSIVSETERKSIRKAFHDPYHFRSVLQAFRNLDEHFQHEKTNALFYDLQVRFLKIVNVLYSRKGQTQISLITDSMVEFVAEHFAKYRSHKDISKTMLPLIKTLCRNRKNCALICTEIFLNALLGIVPPANKFLSAISILRFMSKSPEALMEMSRSEKTFHFIIHTAINHSEKSTNKKYLMGTLYRLTKTANGVQFISKNYLWMLLLEFFLRSERLDELRQRLAYNKAYTILHRGVRIHYVSITPVALNLDFSEEITTFIQEKSNHHSDDSDNEESDDEEEVKGDLNRSRKTSEENDEDEDFEDEDNDVEEEANDFQDKCNDFKIPTEKVSMREFYIELYPNLKDNSSKQLTTFQDLPVDGEVNANARIESRVTRHPLVNRQALPDTLLAESDKNDNGFLTPHINYYSAEEMARRMKQLKGLTKSDFEARTVYDLDALIVEERHASPHIDIPTLDDVRSKMHDFARNKAKHTKVSTLAFEARFECGNLRKVDQVGEYEYELFISPDVNMTNGLQWFYFQVSNMISQKTYTFNIVNFQKANSQFNYGLQPVMFSTVGYIINGTGWRKIGDNLMYFGNEYINKVSDKQFRTLRFSVTFPHPNDYCYFAYHFPYTYTRLMTTIAPFCQPKDHIYSRVDKLSTTVNGFNEVPLVTVTSRNGEICLNKRPIVFLTARVHPGESNASWIMDGVLQCLLSEDKSTEKARQHYIFKIIPMLNPEGVIYGNTRCGLTGNDLNRCWKKPHPILHPEIFYAKKLVEFAKEKLPNDIFTFIDIHGHSRKKYFFLYGCNPKQSWNDNDKSADDGSDASFTLMAKALSANENMKMSFCRNTVERKREATCRVVMWREFGIRCSYTLECSFCSGENKKKVTTRMLREVGQSIVVALADLVDAAPSVDSIDVV